MKLRTNVGFIIIASGRNLTGGEVVLGYNPSTLQYVTWLCHRGDDYTTGHYGTDFVKAVDDFKRRCSR